jgi:NADPH-dependent 2,4-dienoyl-CoA reductase/sulfur reductase-like enzyme/peroxiredoxin family protein/TusA-related sulfurtransferase/rhodanese-related sulfurtransferase
MKLAIIGGGAGGPAVASRARRLDENAEIIMFERGEHVSYGHCGLPYYIGGDIKNRNDLLISNPEKFKELYNVDVRVRSMVKNIIPDKRQIEVVDLENGDSYTEQYDKLILATGANPVKPPLPGVDMEEIFTLRNLTDADKINQFIQDRKPRKAVIIGGGFIGLEMAENFDHLGMDVILVEMLDQVMPPIDPEMAELIHRTLALHGIELALSDAVAGFERRDGNVIVKLKSGREIPCDIVMLSIGVKPNLELAKAAGVETGESGGIKVDDHMRTSNPDIYAVGDAVETTHLVTGNPVLVPLAGLAARQARVAIDNINGREQKYRGTLGTSLVKVFETTVGNVGVNEKTLKKLDIEYEKCYVHPFSHVTYYPDAAPMIIKLLFSPGDGRILGAQIVGTEGVDKRIDSLATAMEASMTVEDLTHLELGYVPQLGSAKEALNIAGFVATNILNGDMPVNHWDEMEELMKSGIFLDVRSQDVVGMGGVPGAMNIPLHDLRDRMDELPSGVPIYTYCNVGQESYIATRMLRQHGFDARNMSGGYGMYKCSCDCEDKTEAVFEQSEKASKAPLINAQTADSPEKVTFLDACGLQCPGPIMRVKERMYELQPGSVLEVSANDTGFATDFPAWCRSVGHEVLSIEVRDGKIVGQVRKCDPEQEQEGSLAEVKTKQTATREKTIVVFSNDMDKVMAAFIIANGAASMGSKVNLFFTFWGLNVLRKPEKVRTSKSLIERMFGWMMPKGSSKLTLSKMNMGGMGTRMMKNVMKQKNVLTLEELIEMAHKQGVRLIACTMTMSIMGLRKEELLDDVEEGGVAAFLENADRSNVTMFI